MTSPSEKGLAKDIVAGRTKPEASPARGEGRPIISPDSPIFKDVHVVLNAALGKAELSVQDILALKSGSVVRLDAKLNDLVELWLNDSLIARGEIVAVEDSFAVRIVEIAQLS
jgi:flagellar motor switch protein FliN/FliY